MKHFIYADNAATTKLDIEAFEAMMPFLLEEYGNASQPYSFSRSSKAALKKARQTIADCINAEPEEIYFTSGGTESDNWAIKGSALVYDDHRETITSKIEHYAILNACAAVERLGYPIAYLPVDREGIVQPNTLREFISERTKLVSIMMANNEIGTIQPISQLASITHKHGALFHTDAVQAVGHMKINVKELCVDMLSASAHKFNGPKGIGFLYIRKGTNISPYIDGGAQESMLRAGTENIASIVGMAVALEKNCANINANTMYLRRLETILIGVLRDADIDYVRNGSENRVPGSISLSFNGADGEALLHRLDLLGICVSTGSACDSTSTKISHVLLAINLNEKYIKGTIRISLGKDNTEDDIFFIANALKKILR